jgi:hypothetical protein
MAKKESIPELAGRISRRDFARRAALAAASAAVMPTRLLAQPLPTSALVAPQAPPNEQKLSPASQAEVDARIQIIFKKYGDRLAEEQKKDIQRLVTEGQKPLDTLRAYKIENSDQPATVFKLPQESPALKRRPAAAEAARPQRKE